MEDVGHYVNFRVQFVLPSPFLSEFIFISCIMCSYYFCFDALYSPRPRINRGKEMGDEPLKIPVGIVLIVLIVMRT